MECEAAGCRIKVCCEVASYAVVGQGDFEQERVKTKMPTSCIVFEGILLPVYGERQGCGDGVGLRIQS